MLTRRTLKSGQEGHYEITPTVRDTIRKSFLVYLPAWEPYTSVATLRAASKSAG